MFLVKHKLKVFAILKHLKLLQGNITKIKTKLKLSGFVNCDVQYWCPVK